jgi:HEPN domain-containing protein
MSLEKNRQQAQRWLKTAEGDLSAAEILLEHGKYAHSCFQSQQAGEKAMKAIWFFLDADPWGHSIKKLIQDLEHIDLNTYKEFEPLKRNAVLLDRYYITTRYPDGLPDLTPEEVFLEEDAKQCIDNAGIIIRTASRLLQVQ